MPMASDTVTGVVKSVFFSSPNDLFKIMLVKIKATTLTWTEDEIVVKGSFGDIKEDETYTFTGGLVSHPKYGMQFNAESYRSEQPTSRDGLIGYLASNRFPGIGKKTAEKIVDVLGLNAVDEIMHDPKVLDQVGIKPDRAATLIAALKENLGMEQVVIGLNGFGLSGNIAAKIYAQYHEDSLDILKKNPYQLVEDIDGIGFKTADGIAQQLGLAADSPERLAGALQMVLIDASENDGDTYVDAQAAFPAVRQLLGDHAGKIAGDDALLAVLKTQVEQRKVVLQDGHIFAKRLYDAEWQIGSHLAALEAAAHEQPVSKDKLEKTIRLVEKHQDIEYDDTQRAAITGALSHRIFLLTGGPGTGKTTIINAVVHAYAELNDIDLDPNRYKSGEVFPIMLAAPTGRAAKRMTETTGLPASTIHRLLGLGVDQADYETRDLPDGLLVIDEVSMVDTYLMRILLDAVHPGITLIFVGDKDQLPSVGPGQVFADMLASGALPAVELTHIHRQDSDSSIVPLAHAVNEGKLPDDLLAKHADRSFVACQPNQVPDAVGQVAAAAVRRGFDPMAVQVLAPMYRGVAGVDRLNPLMQDIFNPLGEKHRKQVDAGNCVYRIGDKVLQLVNNPDKNVYNGEIGLVTGITIGERGKGDSLTLDFDGNEITYPRAEWSKITLAYATSIHKAQGSEFDMVILPLTMQSRRMLQRNLVYTAITRAKRFLILIGEPAAFELAAQTLAANRKTGLRRRLRDAFSLADDDAADSAEIPAADQSAAAATTSNAEADVAVSSATTSTSNEVSPVPAAPQNSGPMILTMKMITEASVDPMIGMHGITPNNVMEGA
ncbi:SF1B family DNA helicase RecD2 [Lacticaseibacillus zhaodongensis]|uniref:SF1B family DNA helicase RecD2 n=1 Tax=Lacticaseibacillus zhaodongensis TaxID=2668065 RepID=UPI003531480D